MKSKQEVDNLSHILRTNILMNDAGTQQLYGPSIQALSWYTQPELGYRSEQEVQTKITTLTEELIPYTNLPQYTYKYKSIKLAIKLLTDIRENNEWNINDLTSILN